MTRELGSAQPPGSLAWSLCVGPAYSWLRNKQQSMGWNAKHPAGTTEINEENNPRKSKYFYKQENMFFTFHIPSGLPQCTVFPVGKTGLDV